MGCHRIAREKVYAASYTVQAVYNVVPFPYYVTVEASNQYGDLYGNWLSVYIDGQYRGASGRSFGVYEGYHNVEVQPTSISDPYYGGTTYFGAWTDEYWNILSYNNPEAFYVNSDMTLWARYGW